MAEFRRNRIFATIANNLVFIFILIIGSIITGGFALSIYIHGREKFYELNFGEFAIAMATLLLAAFTYELARSEVHESRNERRRLRIKEQLSFYAPLIPEAEAYYIKNELPNHWLSRIDSKYRIKETYVLLAEDELEEKFTLYYRNYEGVAYKESETEWNELTSEIISIIMRDFNRLKEKYLEYINV